VNNVKRSTKGTTLAELRKQLILFKVLDEIGGA
jgi:hypothetical protein